MQLREVLENERNLTRPLRTQVEDFETRAQSFLDSLIPSDEEEEDEDD